MTWKLLNDRTKLDQLPRDPLAAQLGYHDTESTETFSEYQPSQEITWTQTPGFHLEASSTHLLFLDFTQNTGNSSFNHSFFFFSTLPNQYHFILSFLTHHPTAPFPKIFFHCAFLIFISIINKLPHTLFSPIIFPSSFPSCLILKILLLVLFFWS